LVGQYAELSERRLDNMQSYLRDGWTICKVIWENAKQYAELSGRRLNNMQSYLEEGWTICRVI
jgi:translation initiation factor 2 alpha subunit (eIF-2alpha)